MDNLGNSFGTNMLKFYNFGPHTQLLMGLATINFNIFSIHPALFCHIELDSWKLPPLILFIQDMRSFLEKHERLACIG